MPKRCKNNKGGFETIVEKTCKWYRVYETRLAINLLEPWEKCLANVLMIMLTPLALYIILWMAKVCASYLL